MQKQYEEIMTGLGWTVTKSNDTVYICKTTSRGQTHLFYINANESVPTQLKIIANAYDIDEQTKERIKNGESTPTIVIFDDEKHFKDELIALANELKQTQNKLGDKTPENTPDKKPCRCVLIKVVEREIHEPMLFDSFEKAQQAMKSDLQQIAQISDKDCADFANKTVYITASEEAFDIYLGSNFAACESYADNYDWHIFEI